jgi:flagellar hook-associated protein 3 FlgL
VSTGLRITHKSITAGALGNLQSNLGRMQRLQEQLSSGSRIGRPSDDPTGTVDSMRFRSEIRQAEQHVRNVDDGLGWLGTADTAVTNALGVVRKAKELALTGANGAMGPTEREALASELDGLREHLFSLAGTEYLGRPIFGGTETAAYAKAADGTITYAGDQGRVTRRPAAGVEVDVNIPGTAVFGPPGADVFAVLSDLANHLRGRAADGTPDPSAVALDGTTDLGALDDRFRALQDGLSTVGARYAQLEVMRTRAEDAQVTVKEQLSEVQSVDLPKTIMELQLQEVAYQSALAATSRTIQPSLMDFLR